MKNVVLFLSIALTVLLSFTACGGGGGGGGDSTSSTEHQITGTVATGEGALAEVTLVGANGESVTTTSDSNGHYSADTSGLTQPIMIRAVLLTDGSVLYSFAATGSGVANVTPITSFIVDQAAVTAGANGGASEMFNSFEDATVPNTFVNAISSQTTTISGTISAIMESQDVGDFDHFSGEFDADHTGYDAVLDALDIEVYDDDIIIRVDDTTLDTINYDITTTTIDLTGRIIDATTSSSIANATVTLTNATEGSFNATTTTDGSFSLEVTTMRLYDITIAAAGYDTLVIPNVPTFVLSDSDIGTLSLLPEDYSTSVDLSGLVFDGRTQATAITNASLVFRSGYNERLATPVATASSNASGLYDVTLDAGTYCVEVSADAFNTRYVNITVYNSSTTYNFPLYADTSNLETSAFATITLSWDANPSDMNSHLTGPIPNSDSRYHIAYYNMAVNENGEGVNDYAEFDYTPYYIYDDNGNYVGFDEDAYNEAYEEYLSSVDSDTPCSQGQIASLDRDDVDGYGPETTTICSVVDGGLYRYYLHHFSGSGTMSSGNATVTVITANGSTRTFTAPSAGSVGYNDIWHVFNIDSDGNVYPVNEMIGTGSSSSALFVAPGLNSDAHFSSDDNIFINLPAK